MTDDHRDYDEEAYWQEFCPPCGTSPCEGACTEPSYYPIPPSLRRVDD